MLFFDLSQGLALSKHDPAASMDCMPRPRNEFPYLKQLSSLSLAIQALTLTNPRRFFLLPPLPDFVLPTRLRNLCLAVSLPCTLVPCVHILSCRMILYSRVSYVYASIGPERYMKRKTLLKQQEFPWSAQLKLTIWSSVCVRPTQ